MRIAAAKAARDTRAAMGLKARIVVVKGLLSVDKAAGLVSEAVGKMKRGRASFYTWEQRALVVAVLFVSQGAHQSGPACCGRGR